MTRRPRKIEWVRHQRHLWSEFHNRLIHAQNGLNCRVLKNLSNRNVFAEYICILHSTFAEYILYCTVWMVNVVTNWKYWTLDLLVSRTSFKPTTDHFNSALFCKKRVILTPLWSIEKPVCNNIDSPHCTNKTKKLTCAKMSFIVSEASGSPCPRILSNLRILTCKNGSEIPLTSCSGE